MNNHCDVKFPFKPTYDVKTSDMRTMIKHQQMTFLNMFFTEHLMTLTDKDIGLKMSEMLMEGILKSVPYGNASEGTSALWHYIVFKSIQVVWEMNEDYTKILSTVPQNLRCGYEHVIIPLKSIFPVLTSVARSDSHIVAQVCTFMENQKNHYCSNYEKCPQNAAVFTMVEFLKSIVTKNNKRTCYTIRWKPIWDASYYAKGFVILTYMTLLVFPFPLPLT